jgi:hypothetical protein
MDILIVSILGLVAILIWDIQIRITNYIKLHTELDHNYPYFSSNDIWASKRKIKIFNEVCEDAKNKFDTYYEFHKDEINKIKKNRDHKQEYKDLISSWHNSMDELDLEGKRCNTMQEANYSISSGRKTFKQISDELFKETTNFTYKKGRYEVWLETEKK